MSGEQKRQKINNSKLKVGDYVRISKKKGTFKKGYLKNYSEELFIIIQVKDSNPLHYKLVDLDGKHIDGVFYPQQLSPALPEQNARISEVVEERVNRRTKQKQYRVRWIGEGPLAGEWISDSDNQFAHISL